MLAAGEAWARGAGCTEMASDVEIGNERSVSVHEQLGYLEVTRIVCYRKALSEPSADPTG